MSKTRVDAVRGLCDLAVEPDGMTYQADSVVARPTREDTPYDGVRLRPEADLAGGRARLQNDVGFGDAVVPPARVRAYPCLPDRPRPQACAYERALSSARLRGVRPRARGEVT